MERQQEILKCDEMNIPMFLNNPNRQEIRKKENPSHNLEWEVLTIVQHWFRCRVSEALYIAYHKPNLNKQVQSFELALFPRGMEITYIEHSLEQGSNSDDELNCSKTFS